MSSCKIVPFVLCVIIVCLQNLTKVVISDIVNGRFVFPLFIFWWIVWDSVTFIMRTRDDTYTEIHIFELGSNYIGKDTFFLNKLRDINMWKLSRSHLWPTIDLLLICWSKRVTEHIYHQVISCNNATFTYKSPSQHHN